MKRACAIFLILVLLLICPVAAAQTEYIDNESGVRFTVPNAWHQKAMSEDRAFLDVKFVNDNFPGSSIIYGSTDLWSQLSASEKIGSTRSDMDNSIFSVADIASTFGITEDNVTTVTYNDRSYFSFEMTTSFSLGEISISGTMTQLVHVENGWFYMFQVSDTKGGEYYKDFESILLSIQYPSASVESIVSTNQSSETENSVTTETINSASVEEKSFDASDFDTQTMTVLCIVLFLVICGIFFAIFKFVTNEKQSVPIPTSTIQEHTCSTCGEKLPQDSTFCHKCGTKITIKEN